MVKKEIKEWIAVKNRLKFGQRNAAYLKIELMKVCVCLID